MTSRLPNHGETGYDTPLVDWLLVAHNADGTEKTPGPAGPAGPAGTGSASIMEAQLASGSSAGASSVTLDRSAPSGWAPQAFVLVDAYTAGAEIRKINTAAGTALTFTAALSNAHSASAVILLLQADPHPGMWGAVGNGSTDDHDALQAAIVSASAASLVLNGQNKNYLVTSPLLFPNGHQVRDMLCTAKATFAPADSTNAMAMTQSGNIVTVASADPATDIITTSVAHGIPGDGIGVVFQGASLPAGLVAGRFYYAYNRTTFTFTVSASSGGATVDITGTGTGTAFCEVYASNAKSFLNHVTFECNNVAALNGIMCSVQQNTRWDTVRVNNAPGYGIKVKGQQADWRNVQTNGGGDGVQFDNMTELYVKDLDIENFSGAALKGVAQAGAGPSLIDSHILGFHVETRTSGAGTYFDFTAAAFQNTYFGVIHLAGLSVDSASNVGFDLGAVGAQICTGQIQGINFSGAASGGLSIAVRDNYRGKTIKVFDTGGTTSTDRQLGQLILPEIPGSAGFNDAYVGTTWWGIGGKELRVGRSQNAAPIIELTPGSAQTADSLIARDTSATQKLGVTKDANLWLAKMLVGSTAGPSVSSGTGSPEGVVTAPVGSLYLRSDGGAGTSHYVKESGAGNTGWVAK